MSYDFHGLYDFVKTRKEHKCALCGRVFPRKSILLKYSGKFERVFVFGYYCYACACYIEIASVEKDVDSYDLDVFLDMHPPEYDELWLTELKDLTYEEGLTHELECIRRLTFRVVKIA